MTEPAAPQRLVGRTPRVAPAELLAALVPPRHFRDATFASYRPEPDHPSQQAALDRLQAFAAGVTRRPRWRRRAGSGIYLDGGFGVGKTHLLAALAHALGPQGAAYATFTEYTHLVGALGFAATVEGLAGRSVVCIDEFELDDPGDTMVMSRLVRELTDRGVHLAATSNTLPEALGLGRFAAEDFLREIQQLAARFEVARVDGEDFRHRTAVTSGRGHDDGAVRDRAWVHPGAALDDFGQLLDHLARVHPSRYAALLDGIELVCLTGVRPVPHQAAALRLVAFVDRLYEADVPVLLGGGGLTGLFGDEMLAGGYAKKYLRALSRLGELAG